MYIFHFNYFLTWTCQCSFLDKLNTNFKCGCFNFFYNMELYLRFLLL